MKNLKKIIGLVISCSILFTACSYKNNDNTNDNGKLKVVTTIFPEYDLTRAIAKDKIDLSLMIKPGVDVHSFSPTPQDIKKIQEADILIYGGTTHDKWVEDMLKSTDLSNKKVIKMSDNIEQLDEEVVEGMKHEHHHEGEHKHEDEKNEEDEHHHEGEHHHHDHEGEKDPHYWTSPKNAIIMVNTIEKSLSEIDEKNKGFYEENAKKYIEELTKVQKELKEVAENAKTNKIVIADRFPFRYLFEDLKLEYRAFFSGCSVESQASAGQVAEMVKYVNENKLPVVYHIEMGKGDLAKSVSESTGAKVLLLHSIHTVTVDEFEKGVTYIDLMKENIKALKEGLN